MFDQNTTDDERQNDELAPGTTLLRGQYRIEQYLVRGGFGITYLARDSLDRSYVIKECFPGALCCRKNGKLQALSPEWDEKFASILRHFLSEARRVAKLSHPSIVGVHQVFEENDTAYMAMEVVDGDDLLSIVEDFPERLTPLVLESTLRAALRAIIYIHDLGILHRDISPDNFLLGPDNHLTLIDFGAAREHAGKENRALSALLAVKDGYSPHEFYLTDVEQGACSDLYSLGATFYHLITGDAPPNSQDRVAALAADQFDPYVPLAQADWDLDPHLLGTIDRALEVLPKDRFASARDWLTELENGPEDVAAMAEPVMLEGDLKRVISRLVEDTNKSVQQGMPGDAAMLAEKHKKRRNARVLYSEEETKPKVKVDIFGNPVKNVDAWMREQSKNGAAAPKAVQAPAKPKAKTRVVDEQTPQDTPNAPAGRSAIGRLISACLPTRRDPASSALSN